MFDRNKIIPANFNHWAFIGSSLFLLSLAVFSLIRFQKQKEAADLITHTYQVKLKIEQCFGLVLEAESNQRGFILRKDSGYLKNLTHADLLVHSNLHQLDSLVADNADQRNNFQALQSLILFRMARLYDVLDSFKISGNPFKVNLTARGKLLMDSIHQQVTGMQAAEDSLLGQRTFVKRFQDKMVVAIILLFSFIAFTILMYSFFKIKKESTLRQQAQTDASHLENLVNERTLEIKKINSLLKEQNAKLERKNLDLTSFTNIASHDLKEPLRKIQLFTHMIIESNPEYLTGKSMEYFNKISQQSIRMQVLIQSVLQYAQTDDSIHGFRQTDLNQVAQSALDSLSEIIKDKKALIKVSELPQVFCNPDQLEQVFINLIENAIKYSKTSETPAIEITAARIEEKTNQHPSPAFFWHINFRDNGIGFDETYSKKIFEIFQRLHGQDAYPGSGIGLAICKRIMENHQGRISVTSALGKGSVFSVILPENQEINLIIPE